MLLFMSRHINAILINDDLANEPYTLGEALGVPQDQLSLMSSGGNLHEVEKSCDDIAVGYLNGWTVMWGRPILCNDFDDPKFAALSSGAKLLYFVAEGTSGTYGFSWYVDGVKIRQWIEQEGEILIDAGTLLPEEGKLPDAEDDIEWHVLGIVEKLAIPIDELYAARYNVYRIGQESRRGSR